MTESILKDWDNFYVITGSSAAGLTGLTFVVIALSAEARRVSVKGLRIYVTPTIVHFGAVLALAAFLSMPHQSLPLLSIGLGLAGAVGFVYAAFIGVGIRRVASDYSPVAEDWIWNVILPALCYATLLAVAFLAWKYTQPCLYAVAAVSVALMFTGIHNAWDIAVWNSVRQANDKSSGPEMS